MAEANEELPRSPAEGKVNEVRKQFSLREDGALAYKIQEQEIEEHYGLNRMNRRTVRGDIPVARVVQTQEEIEQQKERMRKLAALQAQAEADEIVARRINQQVQDEVRRTEVVREIEDEELARQLQEKEKVKYERYLEKKKERRLKKEREKLEQQLAKTTEEARLSLTTQPAAVHADRARQDMEALRLQGASPSNGMTRYHIRVTPSGHIEDDGDFSDFFAVPPDNVHPAEWEHVQQQQDEELARLLQEQEHKRSKAEVDRHKLREIEVRDEQLAVIIQEQERLKEKKYKQKHQQKKEQQKLERQHASQESGLPLGASANMLSQMAPAGDHNHHRYRRNSYTKSIDNGPAPVPEGEQSHRLAGSRSFGQEEWTLSAGVDHRPPMPVPQNPNMVHRTLIQVNNPNPEVRTATSHQPPRRQVPSAELSPDEAPEVLRWLQSHGAPVVIPSPEDDPHNRGRHSSPSRDLCDEEVSGLSSQAANYNIATAIDPTYHRRQPQMEDTNRTTVKMALTTSRSLPVAEGTTDWEPGVRGSLRRLKGTLKPYINVPETSTPLEDSQNDSSLDDGSQNGTFQPVQGQKRSTLDNRNRKARKPNTEPKGGGKGSNSCKQQ